MLALGGPEIPFRPGRRDSKVSPPEGRLPAYTNCESFLLFCFCFVCAMGSSPRVSSPEARLPAYGNYESLFAYDNRFWEWVGVAGWGRKLERHPGDAREVLVPPDPTPHPNRSRRRRRRASSAAAPAKRSAITPR